MEGRYGNITKTIIQAYFSSNSFHKSKVEKSNVASSKTYQLEELKSKSRLTTGISLKLDFPTTHPHPHPEKF